MADDGRQITEPESHRTSEIRTTKDQMTDDRRQTTEKDSLFREVTAEGGGFGDHGGEEAADLLKFFKEASTNLWPDVIKLLPGILESRA
jgi:hypothetical protein